MMRKMSTNWTAVSYPCDCTADLAMFSNYDHDVDTLVKKMKETKSRLMKRVMKFIFNISFI